MEPKITFNVKLNRIGTAAGAVHAMLGLIVRKTCFDIEGVAKQNAAVDTGAMRASIYSVVEGQDGSGDADAAALAANPKAELLPKPDLTVDTMNGFVAVGASYAGYIEYGTTRAPAQPFLSPAVDQVRPSFEAAASQLRQAVSSAPSVTELIP
ncbi:MAG: hypothetical protein LC772_06555 [Chloroflexi bacterium]|nr:hypothetical protein [Chloroflexota bacterium]